MSTYLLIAIVVLQLADIVTTYLALTSGKGVESNGLLAPLFRILGVLPTLIVVKGSFIALLIWSAPLVSLELLGLVSGLYVWVIFNNARVLQK